MGIFVFEYLGDDFVFGAARDIYTNKSGKEVKAALLSIEMVQGLTTVVIQKDADGKFHMATASVDGYLFGDCFWDYLKALDVISSAKNIIYCEEQEGKVGECCLVIISNNMVMYDAMISTKELDDIAVEVIISSGEAFDLFVHGNAPFPLQSSKDAMGGMVFLSDIISSYTVIDQPNLPHLKANKKYFLSDIPTALRKASISFPTRPVIIVTVLVVIIYWIATSIKPSQLAETVIQDRKPIDHYVGFNNKLMTPHPNTVLNALTGLQMELFDLPKMAIQKITYLHSKENIEVKARILASNHEELSLLLENLQWGVVFENGSVLLTKPLLLKNREKPTDIYPLTRLIPVLLDEIYQIYATLSISDISQNRFYGQKKVIITYDENYFPAYKTLNIRALLKNMPIFIEKLEVTYSSPTNSKVVWTASLLGE